MSRFSLNLEEVSTERLLCPKGAYPMRIAKAEVRKGVKDDKNWMMLNLTLAIKDAEVSQYLGQDEPKLFHSIMISFDKETGEFSMKNNQEIALLSRALGIEGQSKVFEEGTEEATTWFDFAVIYFTNYCNVLVGYDVLGNVDHKPSFRDKTQMEAVITKIAAAN